MAWRAGGLLLVVIGAGLLWLQFAHDWDPYNPNDFESHVYFHWNTVEYHGERFRIRRPYMTYEDYKDDPDNLDPLAFDRASREGSEAGNFTFVITASIC
jgi:hypothetical protein